MADNENDVARLLALYSSKPPKAKLTGEEKHRLHSIVHSKDMKLLLDYVRIKAWQRLVPVMRMQPAEKDFVVEFAKRKGEHDGMLLALELLTAAVEKEDGSDTEV